MKTFDVEFRLCDSEFFTALRLVASAVCTAADIDVDKLEDFKVCVTESALILKNCGFERVKVSFRIGEDVGALIEGIGGTPKKGDNELSLELIGALVKNCDFSGSDGKIEKVKLTL